MAIACARSYARFWSKLLARSNVPTLCSRDGGRIPGAALCWMLLPVAFANGSREWGCAVAAMVAWLPANTSGSDEIFNVIPNF